MKPAENWEPFMTRNQAVAMAEELATKGMSQANIALKLADAGYSNPKTNKPVSAPTICMMLKKKKRKKAPPPARRERSRDEEASNIRQGIGGRLDSEAQRYGGGRANCSGAAGA